MNDNCQEEIGFGETPPKMYWPPPRLKVPSDFMFFPDQKKVIDKIDLVVYSISQFKKIYLNAIKEELEYQRNIDKRKIEAKQSFPFKLSDFEEGYLNSGIEKSEERIKLFKNILNRCVKIKTTQQGFDINKAKTRPISDFVELNKFNKACCPFHKEKTPSFVYYPKENRWWCFGACGEGGDVLDFIIKRDGVSLPEAIRICLNIH